ncbi:phosphomevalonate kinase [Coniosporium apollinis]|uniref:Phosphomevalonate kinase n=2 Tax=Coniosporium TaxID=2810619 RepID=A0ABQ9P0F3_9PEZI|nr:phosphomevalonate kinase [Cladosporium sp. JES 115]KAJ9667488.1 phosphomevalonate kinase [Coniosporium apollinis]
MALPSKAVSAPGKVLLAGGYLVLDREYTGLVFGLDARIHVHIQPLHTSSGVTLSEIIVRSPQFKYAIWEYGYRWTGPDGGMQVTHLRVSALQKLQSNPFVETALSYALSYISTVAGPAINPASITILADNDYYSQTAANGKSSSDRFQNFGVPLSEAHKTGLGSSAALVTAFTAALLVHYLPEKQFSLSTDVGRSRLHNLAQAAHCAAQGKVGSGFDVASAVYGSCRYRRFSPSLLESHGEPGSSGFAAKLKSLVEESDPSTTWDTEIVKSAVKVPSGLRLVMCDVDCGSKTPGMVTRLLAWRKEKPEEADRIWKQLQEKNEGLAAELVRLAENKSHDYQQLRECITGIRSLTREMSKCSGVPVEPESQTRLLDACSSVPGVVGGVVPGAGGFDAVALLIEDKEEVISELSGLLERWDHDEQEGSEARVGRVRLLHVREDMEGVRAEDPAGYEGWLQ